jgi:hypothetical protein
MDDIRVATWNDLTDQLFAGSWQPDIERFRSSFVFRGMTCARYDLTTSLARATGSRQLEDHMLRAFRKYAYAPELATYSIWHWLALAQHHGLSTRLLDWTYSPLIAMHFVTEGPEHFDEDGVIWAVDHTRSNALLPSRLSDLLEDEGTAVFTADMLNRAAQSLRGFDSLSDEPFVAFFEPPSLDERIINQYALFSLVSDPQVRLDEWLAEHPDVFRRIIVPKELKVEIRDRLDNSNITERVLYPGLDGLTRWLNRYYSPRMKTVDRHHGQLPPDSIQSR